MIGHVLKWATHTYTEEREGKGERERERVMYALTEFWEAVGEWQEDCKA